MGRQRKTSEKLTTRQERILAALWIDHMVTMSEIANRLGKPVRTLQDHAYKIGLPPRNRMSRPPVPVSQPAPTADERSEKLKRRYADLARRKILAGRMRNPPAVHFHNSCGLMSPPIRVIDEETRRLIDEAVEGQHVEASRRRAAQPVPRKHAKRAMEHD